MCVFKGGRVLERWFGVRVCLCMFFCLWLSVHLCVCVCARVGFCLPVCVRVWVCVHAHVRGGIGLG